MDVVEPKQVESTGPEAGVTGSPKSATAEESGESLTQTCCAIILHSIAPDRRDLPPMLWWLCSVCTCNRAKAVGFTVHLRGLSVKSKAPSPLIMSTQGWGKEISGAARSHLFVLSFYQHAKGQLSKCEISPPTFWPATVFLGIVKAYRWEDQPCSDR